MDEDLREKLARTLLGGDRIFWDEATAAKKYVAYRQAEAVMRLLKAEGYGLEPRPATGLSLRVLR